MTIEVAGVEAGIAIAVEAENGAEVGGDVVEVEEEGIQETLWRWEKFAVYATMAMALSIM